MLLGGTILGILIFFFPSLYGEGYEAVNTALSGDYSPLFNESIFFPYRESMTVVFILFVLIIVFKVIATTAILLAL